jgi:hypothetical protein
MKSGMFAGALLASAFALTSVVQAEPLTLDTVTALSATGIGDQAIIAKIKSSGTHIDLTPEQMIALKGKGVSGPVIAALLDVDTSKPAMMLPDSPDPLAPHPSGVYFLAPVAGAKMQRIEPTVSNQAKTGGIFGYALTGGLASMSMKAAIQNAAAKVRATGVRPTFYFFFDESNPDTVKTASSWAAGTAATVSSPAEFSLIKLIQKDGRREARVGSINIGGAKTGVMDKDRLPFSYDLVRPGVYRVTPQADLAAGEYGFIYAINGAGVAGAMSARVFDFGI